MTQPLLSVCIGTYNEEGNLELTWRRLTEVMQTLSGYDYEIIFSDNDSQDRTRDILRSICKQDSHVRAILNSRNFGPSRSGMNMLKAAGGDAIIVMPADLQEPPEMIPDFVRCWEDGYPIVLGQREDSASGFIDVALRKIYYSIIDKLSDTPQRRQVTGFGLYDHSVIRTLDRIGDSTTDMRFQISDLGYRTKILPYKQAKRIHGKSSYNWYRFFGFGMDSLCSTSRKPLRMMTVLGSLASLTCFIIGLVYLVYKLMLWDTFSAGSAPMLIGLFFIGSILVLFLGVVGEYIGLILERLKDINRPYVIEDERINF